MPQTWWRRRLLPRKQKDVTQSEEPSKHKDDGTISDTTESLYKVPSHEGTRPDEPCCIDIRGIHVTSLVFLTDGKTIVGGCNDGSIRQWSVSDRCEIGQAMKSDGAVSSITASSDGKWIASGAVDCKVTIWNLTDPNRNTHGSLKHFDTQTGVTALDISPNSSCIVAGSENGLVYVWCLDGGECIAGPLKHSSASRISSVKFSPTGERLASACAGWDCDSIFIWDTRTSGHIASLSADSRPTSSLSWSHDGQRLFAGGPYGSIRCFNIADQSIISRFGGQFCDFVTSLCVSNSGRFLVAASASCLSLSLWDVNTFEQIQPTLLQPTEALAMAISPDDQRLVAVTDEKISVWDLSSVVPSSYSFKRLAPYLSNSEPFTYVSQPVYRAWKHGKLEEAERILSNEITNLDPEELRAYSHANRALVRARLGRLRDALEDAQMSKGASPLIIYIAQSFALFRDGNYEKATKVFDSALAICDGNSRPFVELVKLIILFECGHHDNVESIRHETDTTTNIGLLRCAVKARMLVLLAERSMKEQQYAQAIQRLDEAEAISSLTQVPELTMVMLIFGWDFDHDLKRIIQQQKCRALFANGSAREATLFFLAVHKNFRREVGNGKEESEWFSDFKSKSLVASKRFGEEAMSNKDYADAIAWYSVVLDLKPASPEQIYVRRSEAYMAIDSWENALMDANEVIDRSPLLPEAYAIKLCALQNLERYIEIAATCDGLPAPLHHQHALVTGTIDKSVNETLHDVPVRMIDTKTGLLCNQDKLRRVFKCSPVFWDLALSMTETTNLGNIKHVVENFFRYVMFSHRWQSGEPLYGDVGDRSVYDLSKDQKAGVSKLQVFCSTAGDAGYRWAWSDTCCIDQKDQREFEKSINCMFKWYHRSSLTLVYLWDVSPLSRRGGLSGSKWFERGWTLQELLAPTAIRFFVADWKPYLSDPQENHKESPVIVGEIATAVGVPAAKLLDFLPRPENVHWKLRMASKRETTVPEDSAYCLCGIFDVFMSVIPGEPLYQALGRLLQEVIARSQSRDVSCLAWVGEPSKRNSCLPARVNAYQEPCHLPSSISEEEMTRSVSELESSFTVEQQASALALYTKLKDLRRAELDAGWRLHLPCLAFRVNTFATDRASGSDTDVYIAKANGLEVVKICTKDEFPKEELLLVCPWIQEFLHLAPPHLSNTGPRLDERTRALRFLARLRQPMTALLLSAEGHFHGEYGRVATDHEIVIQLNREDTLDAIDVRVVEII